MYQQNQISPPHLATATRDGQKTFLGEIMESSNGASIRAEDILRSIRAINDETFGGLPASGPAEAEGKLPASGKADLILGNMEYLHKILGQLENEVNRLRAKL